MKWFPVASFGIFPVLEAELHRITCSFKKLMPIRRNGVININIPLLSKGRPKGIQVVPQSSKGFDESYIQQENEQGQTVFQLTGREHLTDHAPVDTRSLEEGFITITVLTQDMTNKRKTDNLKNKFKDFVL